MDYENLKKHKKGWITGGVILLIAIISLFAWNNYNAHRIEGDYKGKATFLFWSEDIDMKFSRNKTFTSTYAMDGEKTTEEGTYEISGDKLTLKYKGKTSGGVYAKLKDNRHKIVFTSSDNKIVGNLLNGITLTKKE